MALHTRWGLATGLITRLQRGGISIFGQGIPLLKRQSPGVVGAPQRGLRVPLKAENVGDRRGTGRRAQELSRRTLAARNAEE